MTVSAANLTFCKLGLDPLPSDVYTCHIADVSLLLSTLALINVAPLVVDAAIAFIVLAAIVTLTFVTISVPLSSFTIANSEVPVGLHQFAHSALLHAMIIAFVNATCMAI
jgi:hypothetical protein